MGQAWCKEKSSKAQDSKSPLDRVFVRCAHRIYPGLKEEGSVLGGATQRVTSSEIGYAVSPPRSSMLHRGLSIDSVDRPFHPSEWVDVNLEVPCSPRDSVVLTRLSAITQPEQLQQRASSPSSNSLGSRRPKDEETAGGTPVPPPRRRRRSRRPLPPEPGPNAAANNSSSSTPEDESEEFGHYSQLGAPRPAPPDYEDVASKTSDDEFIAIEESLKRSLENVSQDQELRPDPEQIYEKVIKKRDTTTTEAEAVRPKNHSTASLPNYGKSKPEESSSEEKTAERPPRHIKTASLPRDTSLILSSSDSSSLQKTHETTLSGSRIEEDGAGARSDNSIFKADGEEEEPAFGGRDVKTSTPFKPTAPPLEDSVEEEEGEDTTEFSGNLDFDSSNEPQDHSSSRSFDVSVGRDLVVIEEVVEQHQQQQHSPPRNDDPGYETRSSNAGTVSFLDESHNNSELFQDAADEELSSGILRDAVVNGTDSEDPVQLQRTISAESLPGEMLADEVDEVVAVVAEEKKKEKPKEEEQLDEEKSAKDASNELVRRISVNDSDNASFKTPPTSPQMKTANDEQQSTGKVEEGEESTADKDKSGANENDEEGNPASGGATTTPVNLTGSSDTLAAETTTTTTKSPPLPSSEPQIIPDVKHHQPGSFESEDEFRTKKDAQRPLIDLTVSSPPKNVRINPFNDSSYTGNDSELNNTSAEDAPEKPIRLYRINLFEDQEIENPVIVPTPPRRRHRSKSNLNTSNGKSEVIEALHTYATNDRLI